METNALIQLEIELQDPATEEALLAWWDEARHHLADRARLIRAELAVLTRGHYVATLGFPLPGSWGLVANDRRWKEIERRRPPARVTVRQARRWHRDGNPRDLTTTQLARWLADRTAGRRDFVLLDTLPRASFDDRHVPGAVNLPLHDLGADSAARVIGPDRNRPVVVYCADFG